MLHELIHLLGVGLGSRWYNHLLFSQNSNLTTYFPSNLTPSYLPSFSNFSTANVVAWNGENAIKQYKKILTDFGYNTTNINYLPIENSGTGSQALQHPEEGRYIYNGLKYAEYIYIDGAHYPVILNDIMSSTLDIDNDTEYPTDRAYITEVTLGLLQDVGLDVKYDSEYVTTLQSENTFRLVFATYFPIKGTALTAKILQGDITVTDTFAGSIVGTTKTDELGSYALTYASESPYVIVSCTGGTSSSTNDTFLGQLSTIRLRVYDSVEQSIKDVALTSVTSLIASYIENLRITENNITDLTINTIYNDAVERFSTLLGITEEELFDDYLDTRNARLALTSGILNIFVSIISGAKQNINSDGASEIFTAISNTSNTDAEITSVEFIDEVLSRSDIDPKTSVSGSVARTAIINILADAAHGDGGE